jgi:uncharacterized protein
MGDQATVVFDTSTVVAAACFPRSLGRQAFDFVLDCGSYFACDETLAELLAVLGRPKFDRFVDLSVRLEFFRAYSGQALLLPIAGTLRASRDPKDDMFLELAVTARVRWLITRDNDLLTLSPYRGVEILDAQRFVEQWVQPGP